jgi:glycosyltransferase involved in cell wall biosynthesis
MNPVVLRLRADTALVSAQVFEEAFAGGLTGAIPLEFGRLTEFLDAVLGPVARTHSARDAVTAFRSATKHLDVLSVDYQGLVFLPRLMRLRNASNAPVRFLIVAHAPALYAVDWALLRPLLRKGDRIIAPTRSARHLIDTLCPEISQFVRVIAHPIGALGPTLPPERRLLVLGRLVHGKAVHRVVDAHASMKRRGFDLALDLAGPLTSPDSDAESVYVRSLRARVNRLGLSDCIRFLGPVRGREKATLLAGARLVVNLSTSLEESFGKTVAEALAVGVPSVVTLWDGLSEVAGPLGTTVAVDERRFAMDVDPERLADGLEAALARRVDPGACRDSARRFDPEVVGPQYASMLSEALDERSAIADSPVEPDPTEPATPLRGVLSTVAPLTAYSWAEMFEAVQDEAEACRRALAGYRTATTLCEAAHVRTRVFYALKRTLERTMAGVPVTAPAERLAGTAARDDTPREFLDRIEVAAADPRATRASRVVCLDLLHAEGRTAAVQRGLELLRTEGADSAGMEYLEVESLASRSAAEAVARCSSVDGTGWWDEHAAHRLRQLARLAAIAGCPEAALPRLRHWTERYPDESESGDVWLARALCEVQAELPEDARASLLCASQLLGSDHRVTAAFGVLCELEQLA